MQTLRSIAAQVRSIPDDYRDQLDAGIAWAADVGRYLAEACAISSELAQRFHNDALPIPRPSADMDTLATFGQCAIDAAGGRWEFTVGNPAKRKSYLHILRDNCRRVADAIEDAAMLDAEAERLSDATASNDGADNAETRTRTRTTQQAITLDAIERWKETARSAVENIGAWRDVSYEERDAKYWTGAACLPHVPPRMPNGFRTDTNHMVSEIVAADAKLDPTPLQDVLAAVVAWHTDHHASNLPPQTVLESALERAVTILCAMERRIMQPMKATAADGQPPQTASDARLIPITDAAEVIGDISDDTLRRRLKAAGYEPLQKQGGRDAATLDQYRRAMLAPKDELKYKRLAQHFAAK